MTIGVTMSAVAAPAAMGALADVRAAGAARYVSARLQRARMEAVLRSRDVGFCVTPVSSTYMFGIYVDGNRNGVLSRDIQGGIDTPLGVVERLADNFAHVDFATLPGLPAVDSGSTPPGDDPIRLGASNIATFTAGGTSSSGSLYIRGAGNRQLVVRIYGDTGKTRVLKFDIRTRQWRPL